MERMTHRGGNAGTLAEASPPNEDNVSEIFPGAGSMTPVVNPGRRRTFGPESGMATAEYAIATLAAVGFAGLLVVILKSDEVRGFLLNIIRTALSF